MKCRNRRAGGANLAGRVTGRTKPDRPSLPSWRSVTITRKSKKTGRPSGRPVFCQIIDSPAAAAGEHVDQLLTKRRVAKPPTTSSMANRAIKPQRLMVGITSG